MTFGPRSRWRIRQLSLNPNHSDFARQAIMRDDKFRPASTSWNAILTDVQFWIPVAVLAAGLVVLRWIS